MPTRYIKKPSPVKLINPETEEAINDSDTGKELGPISFDKFVGRLLLHLHYTDSYKACKAANAIKRAVKKFKDAAVLELSNEDWEIGKKIIEEPGPQGFAFLGYAAVLAPQFEEFFDAWMNAKDKPEGEGESEAKKE